MFKELSADILGFIQSDVELKLSTCSDNGVEKVTGFKFYSKAPLSKSYQYHATIGLENTYKILSLIQNAIKHKNRAVQIQISSGIASETIHIWKGSLKKAELQMEDMIKQIQVQY